MFLRLIVIQYTVVPNSVCIILILEFPTEKDGGLDKFAFNIYYLKMFKEAASLASTFNKFHSLITSEDFFNTYSLHFYQILSTMAADGNP